MAPTLGATSGVRGQRPIVGTRDGKDLLYVLATVGTVTGAVYANTLQSPARAKPATGRSKARRLQEAYAAHLRHIGRIYPVERHAQVVVLIDNAPWHRGQPIAEALAANPQVELE